MKRRIGRNDTASSIAAISVVWRAHKLGFLALLELRDTLVPALNDLAPADDEFQRLASLVARVKDGAIGQ